MSVRVMEESRQQTLAAHIAAAANLGSEVRAIERLAQQLHARKLLPVVGAGASYDCGMRVAREIAPDLHAAYTSNTDYAPYDGNLDPTDLGRIAEAIFVRSDQRRVVHELGIPDADLWWPAETFGDHFCVYRVLARMVREGFLAEAFGFNYDCGAEAGLSAEGFAYGDVFPGRQWRDRARIVADGATNASTERDESSFTLFKANGCAVRYRELANDDEEKAAEGIIVRRDQLEKWKDTAWGRDNFRALAQDHVLMLVGFSAQDPKLSAELRDVLEKVYAERDADGLPRVVAIDQDRSATAIEGLIRSGLGGEPAGDDTVTAICIEGSTATAALLVLLTELLAIELGGTLTEAGVTLPTALDARLATLTITLPAMRRWSYLVTAPGPDELIQRANLIAERGYVPLSHDPELSTRLIAARDRVREQLGHNESESSEEALSHDSFILDDSRGLAYMPVGLEQEALAASCRPGAELDKLQATLRGRYPPHLECVLVCGDGRELRGVNLATGKEVQIV